MKKLLALSLALAVTASLAACGGKQEEAPAPAPAETQEVVPQEDAEEPASSEGSVYTVGICQLAPHVALDAATEGFMDALKEELGDQVEFDLQNASGDTPTCATIIN